MVNRIALAAAIAIILIGSAASYTYLTTGQVFPVTSQHAVNCGEIVSHGDSIPPISPNATIDAECFYNAYVNMQNATLDLYYMGVDTGQSNNFSVTSASRTITDRVRGFVDVKQQPSSVIYCSFMGLAHGGAPALIIDGCTGGASFSILLNQTAA